MNIWEKLTRVFYVLIGIAAVLLIVVFYRPQVENNERVRKNILELDKKIEKEEEVSKKLDNATRSLQDPRTVERQAREKLSYAKPGEIVIHFEAPATNASSSQPLR